MKTFSNIRVEVSTKEEFHSLQTFLFQHGFKWGPRGKSREPREFRTYDEGYVSIHGEVGITKGSDRDNHGHKNMAYTDFRDKYMCVKRNGLRKLIL